MDRTVRVSLLAKVSQESTLSARDTRTSPKTTLDLVDITVSDSTEKKWWCPMDKGKHQKVTLFVLDDRKPAARKDMCIDRKETAFVQVYTKTVLLQWVLLTLNIRL